MPKSVELELNYLPKYLPQGLEKCEFEEMIDIYIPEFAAHPKLRIRKRGSTYEITKKSPIVAGDASRQTEHTIPLTEPEFRYLSTLKGKRIHKNRYIYHYKGRTAEVDVFKQDLKGLVLVDFEFDSVSEQEAFEMPEFCLADVTQSDFIAGGLLCGKKYSEIEKELSKLGYKKLIL